LVLDFNTGVIGHRDTEPRRETGDEVHRTTQPHQRDLTAETQRAQRREKM